MPDLGDLRLEFRIPISPTPGFYSQVRAFVFGLDRLGQPYRQARVVVSVGDNCDLDEVRAANGWAEGRVTWQAVPRAVFDEFGIHGTADWRWLSEPNDVDLVILSDADTVLLRNIDPLLRAMPLDRPAIRGHMAHYPPPSSGGGLSPPTEANYWPELFQRFNVRWPSRLYGYSMDQERQLPLAPAYFNLGFVACTSSAISIFKSQVLDFQREFIRQIDSNMRCQIAVTLIAYRNGIDIAVLPAAYNAANDQGHLAANFMSAEDIRVLHYLREDEICRSLIFQEPHIDEFVRMTLSNPANRLLQEFGRAFRDASKIQAAE